MDISSLVGFLLAFGLIIGSMLMGSAPMDAFIDVPSAMVVIGGAIGTDEKKLRQNPRVEIYMLDEVIGDSVGTEAEQQERFTPEPPAP